MSEYTNSCGTPGCKLMNQHYHENPIRGRENTAQNAAKLALSLGALYLLNRKKK